MEGDSVPRWDTGILHHLEDVALSLLASNHYFDKRSSYPCGQDSCVSCKNFVNTKAMLFAVRCLSK